MAALYDAESDMCWETMDNDSSEPNTGKHRQVITRDEAYYIFGISNITDGELSFMTELCKGNINLYKAISLVRARKSDRKRYNLSEKQWRRCLAMAIYESAGDVFCYGL